MSEKNTSPKSDPIIGISIGDLNGIGPEVIIKALEDPRTYRNFTPVIYANGSLISFFRKQLDLQNFNFHQARDIHGIHNKKINVINCWEEKYEVAPGTPHPTAGKFARLSLLAATADLQKGKINALVTGPISKEMTKDESFDFPGHTEFLAHTFQTRDSLMLMCFEELRIGVVTGHIPVRDISKKINKDLISSKLNLLVKSLQTDFNIKKPKIAVLGLNPHAGENGLLGTEEVDIIQPVIQDFKNKGHLVFGPFPADGFFGSSQYVNFDAILAMYHDQGLIPFKNIS